MTEGVQGRGIEPLASRAGCVVYFGAKFFKENEAPDSRKNCTESLRDPKGEKETGKGWKRKSLWGLLVRISFMMA